MAEKRSISVAFKAEFGDFKKQIDDAAKSADSLGQKIEASSKKVESALDKQREAAQKVAHAEKNLEEVKAKSNASAAKVEAATKKVAAAKNVEKAATDALAAAEKSHNAIANQATTRTGRLAQAAQENTQQWQQAGAALTAAGAAITGVGVAALTAGISYNSLQQKSRAAMSTLLGGAEEANAQMDKLDAFARTSPFSKQTFITAQQQMIAFGVETSKVIPYLDALNDTTAAAGGNAQTLGELAFIMAQISAAGKITGQDLIQFGQRGVNAAEMIGLSMGKTGAEIRAEITAGTLDANTALDAMAAGMKQSNDGAAANVKATWEGALDRVKASWRDLGSELAEPLVGAEGGGILVDLANGAADAMRSFQGLPGPIKVTTVAIIGLTGAAALMSGTFLLAAPRLIATRVAITALEKRLPRTTKAMQVTAKAAGVMTAAFLAASALKWVGDQIGSKAQIDSIDAMRNAMTAYSDEVKNANGEVVGMMNVSASLGNLFTYQDSSGWANLTNTAGGLADVIYDLDTHGRGAGAVVSGFADFLGMTANRGTQAREAIENFDGALAQMVAEGNLENAAKFADEFSAAAIAAGKDTVWVAEQLEGYNNALEANAIAEQAAAEQARDANQQRARDMGYFGEMSEEAAKKVQEWRDVGIEAFASFIDGGSAYSDALSELEDAERERAETAAEASADTKDSWEDFYETVDVSAKKYIKQLEKQAEAQANWRENMLDVAKRLKTELPAEMQDAANAMIDEIRAKGPEGAAELEVWKSSSEKQLQKIAQTFKDGGKESADEFNSELDAIRNITIEFDANTGRAIDKIDLLSERLSKVAGKRVVIPYDSGLMGGHATGGAVSGPGTATSDSIPAMLSNGEHVLTASDVDALGGQSAVYRMRGLAQSGMLKFAQGGAVSTAKTARDDAKAAATAAAKAQKRAQERYSDIGSGKDDRAAKAAAKKALNAAKKVKEKADKALKRAESALKDARQRAEYRADFLTDRRRGDTVQSAVREGNGLSSVDDLLSMASSGAFSKLGSKMLRDVANQSEKKILALNKALKSATDSFDNLSALYDDVRGGLSGGFSFDALLGQTDWTGGAVGGSGNELAAGGTAYAGKIGTLGTKIGQLRSAGASQALIEQIATMPLDTAIQVADAFLSDPGSASVASQALSAIDKNANAVGLAVAQGAAGAGAAKLYIGAGGDLGSAAVDALLKNADAIGSNIAAAILGATSTKATTKKAATKAKKKALGGPVSAGQPYLVGEEGPELFWPGATGAIIPSRLTIPAMSGAPSGVSNTAQPIDYDRLAQAVVQAAQASPVAVSVGVSRSGAMEITRSGAKELNRVSDIDWKAATR